MNANALHKSRTDAFQGGKYHFYLTPLNMYGNEVIRIRIRVIFIWPSLCTQKRNLTNQVRFAFLFFFFLHTKKGMIFKKGNILYTQGEHKYEGKIKNKKSLKKLHNFLKHIVVCLVFLQDVQAAL